MSDDELSEILERKSPAENQISETNKQPNQVENGENSNKDHTI